MSLLRVDRRSLRIRLLVWLIGFAALAAGASWLFHDRLHNDLARDFLRERLRSEANHAIDQLQKDWLSAPALMTSSSQIYLIFHHLYVLRLGDTIIASEGRWQDALASLLEEEQEALVEVRDDEYHLLVYRQPFMLNGETGVLLVADDFSHVEAGLFKRHWWVSVIAAGLMLLLVILNLLAVNLGLVPLSRLRDQLVQLQSGKRDRLSLDVPSELDSLVNQLNRLIDEIDDRLRRSRESTANLSHALKTPLTAVIQVLRGTRPIDDERRRKLVQRLEAMHAQLDAELRRTRIAGPNAGRMSQLDQDCGRLLEMFRGLYPEKWFCLTLPTVKSNRVPIESQDLSEMLGIVLDNAGKWASRQVNCTISLDKALRITVEDDGPGVAEDELPHLGQRGRRLDERHPGYGLGLSILRQLVTRYGGQVAFDTGKLDGLRVNIAIPIA
ncbi:sensor histidine kinase [Halomonas jincaotanensis]|uniref:sensor histidine kinase n=1 Tax=Halomonas jincaotanensis TaxID=2810616 RepID=UPI002022F1E8|nr:sensor histidine kinase [Halomonas jincaotanensis]